MALAEKRPTRQGPASHVGHRQQKAPRIGGPPFWGYMTGRSNLDVSLVLCVNEKTKWNQTHEHYC